MNFKPTHRIKLNPDSITGHIYEEGTEVKINTKFITGGGSMVMANAEDGRSQFVEYKELELIANKTQSDENSK